MSKNPQIDFLNEKKIFKRKEDVDFAIFQQELFEDQLNEIRTLKIQNIDDLIKIKHITNSFTDEFFRNVYDNTPCLFGDDGKIKIKTFSGEMPIKKFKTKFGLMITVNRGEWRGELYNITEYGAEQAGIGNFISVFEYDGKLYALDTLSHLSINRSKLHEIRKLEDEFEDIIIFESYDLTFGGYYIEENYLYFYSNSWDFPGLYKFNLDNYELTFLKDDSYFGIYVESLIKKDNYIYLLGCYNLIKYDLNTQKIVDVYTNLDNEEFEKYYDGDIDLIKC